MNYVFVAHNTLSSSSETGSVYTTRPRPGSLNSSSSSSNLKNVAAGGSIAPPPLVPPRSCSETRQLRRNEPDLISFSNISEGGDRAHSLEHNVDISEIDSVTSNKINDSHSNFRQMVDEMHK